MQLTKDIIILFEIYQCSGCTRNKSGELIRCRNSTRPLRKNVEIVGFPGVLLEAEKKDVVIVEFDVVEFAWETMMDYFPAAEKKGLRPRMKGRGNNKMMQSDPELINRILNNIINYALKYTMEGLIEVSVERGSKEKKNFVIFNIKDSGVGIPEESLNLIFDEFRQLSQGSSVSLKAAACDLT